MTEQEKSEMLLEERYATLRSKVRDIYQECHIRSFAKKVNTDRLDVLRSKKTTFFNRKKVQLEIDSLEQENSDIDVFLGQLEDMLVPLASEMEDIEGKIGDRLCSLYGKDYNWWVRR